MKQFFSMISIVVLVLFFFISCDNETKNTNDEEVSDQETGDEEANDDEASAIELKYKKADEHADAVSKEIVAANSALAMDLFSKLSFEESGVNMMISPLSISIAMAMVTNGASDENLAEMKEVLGFKDMTMEAVNAQFYELIQSLVEADKDLVLSIANSVWMDDLFEPRVKEAFLDALLESYEAEPFTIDFQADGAKDTINSWVSENTNGKIEKIIEEIGADTVMYLINAIYFKAAWTITFDKESTYDGQFTLSDESTKTVPMMTFKDAQDFDFYSSGWEDGDYSVIRLPYGRGKFAFYGIIPNSGSIDEFISKMAENGLESYFKNLVETEEVPVIMPKFKFEYEKSLVDIFKTLGMEKAFAEGGFLNLADQGEGLYISDIKHKTFIEVNEEGTEAAAVTSVEVGETSMPAGFYGTRPFVFVIRDDRSGTILFIGKVEDPSVEK
ncbi:MAG TPA: serpin family protein [bacterium]|nr:serpin family protein [bacterium]HQM85774.1 serpin family protein [bacterium]